MKFLRGSLGRPLIPELTEHLTRYFKSSKRRSGESMHEYITRKDEIYLRAQQSLLRVLPQYAKKQNTTPQWPSWSEWPPPGSWSGSRRSSLASEAAEGGEEEVNEATAATGEAGTTSTTREETEYDEDPWRWWARRDWHQSWESPSYGWTSPWGWHGGWGGSYNWSLWRPKEEERTPLLELLPDVVQGWYLLNDANLDTHERLVIQTALQGGFSQARVAQELRSQWPENEVKRRDGHKKQHSYMGEDIDTEEVDELLETEMKPEALIAAGMSTEGVELIGAAEREAQEALAIMRNAKVTLKEARMRQHKVKMARQYYRGGSQNSQGSRPPPHDSRMTCLKCGKVGHRAANCPQRDAAYSSTTSESPEHAPFVCFTESELPEAQEALAAHISTAEAVTQGKAVLDSGATRTIGSVAAIESLMALNHARRGSSGVVGVNVSDRPVFNFGNSSQDRCVSTVDMGLVAHGREGSLQVHALNKGAGPILLSIQTLCALGAVVDYEHDLIVFRKLDDKRIVSLERSATGHQLLPLAEDLLSQGQSVQEPVPSLKAFL